MVTRKSNKIMKVILWTIVLTFIIQLISPIPIVVSAFISLAIVALMVTNAFKRKNVKYNNNKCAHENKREERDRYDWQTKLITCSDCGMAWESTRGIVQEIKD